MSELLSERRGQTLILTFNRPNHENSLTLDMAEALFLALKNATTDKSVRAVLLCGSGKNFMNGLDMSFYKQNMNDALEKANHIILPYHSAIRELQSMDKPVLSAVEGSVTGTGFSLMLASDLVISTKSAKFNTKFAEYGLTPDGGCSFFLPRKVGITRAVEMMMLCEEFNAEQAERFRIVNKVVDDDKLEEEAIKWIDLLAKGPTKAYGAIKKLAMKSFENDINAHLSLEHAYFGQSSRSFDFREAVRSEIKGEKSKFTGS